MCFSLFCFINTPVDILNPCSYGSVWCHRFFKHASTVFARLEHQFAVMIGFVITVGAWPIIICSRLQLCVSLKFQSDLG